MKTQEMAGFEERAVGYTGSEVLFGTDDALAIQDMLRQSGHIAIDRVLEWPRGEKQLAHAVVFLADASRESRHGV